MFHENLKALRKEKGYTQKSLAIALHVVRQTVSKWENGLSVPDAEMLQKIAETLEVSVSQLLGADILDNAENRNEVAEMLAKINEQLAIRNRRGKLIFKIILTVLAVMIVMPLILSILFMVNLDSSQNTAVGKTEWHCALDGKVYICTAEYNEQYRIITTSEATEDGQKFDVDITKYRDANQLGDYLTDYFESRGGTVKVVHLEGLHLVN